MKTSFTMLVLVLLLLSILAGCAPGPNPSKKMASEHGEIAGFWLGLWQGFIAPVVFVASLFREIEVELVYYAWPSRYHCSGCDGHKPTDHNQHFFAPIARGGNVSSSASRYFPRAFGLTAEKIKILSRFPLYALGRITVV